MSVAELLSEHALYAPRPRKTRRYTESVQHARVERSTTTSQSLTHVNTARNFDAQCNDAQRVTCVFACNT